MPVRRASDRLLVWLHNKVVGMGSGVSTNTLEGCPRASYLSYSVPKYYGYYEVLFPLIHYLSEVFSPVSIPSMISGSVLVRNGSTCLSLIPIKIFPRIFVPLHLFLLSASLLEI